MDSADGLDEQLLLESQIQLHTQGQSGVLTAEHARTIIVRVEGVFFHDGVSGVGLAGGRALLLTTSVQHAADRFKGRVFWVFAKGVEEFPAGIQFEFPSILVPREVSFRVKVKGFILAA